MNNDEAIEYLNEFIEMSSNAVQIGTWALAFLQEGGEPTWDSVKSVSRLADSLGKRCEVVATFEDDYENIIPF